MAKAFAFQESRITQNHKDAMMKIYPAVLLVLCFAQTLDAQVFRQRVVCGPTGCYPVYQVPANRVIYSVPTVKVVTSETAVVSPMVDLVYKAESKILQSNEQPFIRTVRQATNKAVKEGKITRFTQVKILAFARLPRIGSDMKLAMESEMDINNWRDVPIEDWIALVEKIIMFLKMIGVFNE